MDIWGYFQPSDISNACHFIFLPMLFISEVGWINVTSIIFVRYEHILLHRDCLAFLAATWENFASPQSCSQSLWSNLWSFSFQYFNPVLSSLAVHGQQISLPTSLISTWQDWETVPGIYSRDAGESRVSGGGLRWGLHDAIITRGVERTDRNTGRGRGRGGRRGDSELSGGGIWG